MSKFVFRAIFAPAFAVAGVGAIVWMSRVWLELKNLNTDLLLKLLLTTSYWIGVTGLLYCVFFGSTILWLNSKLLGQVEVIVHLVAESNERYESPLGHISKWYVIFVGTSVPLLFAMQAFGIMSDSWLPTTSSDWQMVSIYLVSQLSIFVYTLVSRQIPWIYDVQSNESGLCCSSFGINDQMAIEDILYAGRFGTFVFIMPRKKRLPVLITLAPKIESE